MTAIFLVMQGILILCTGSLRRIGAYFGTPPRPGLKLPRLSLWVTGGFYIVTGVAVLALILLVGLRSGLTVSEAAQRVWAANINILFVLLFLVPGVYALIRPRELLIWLGRSNPEIPHDNPFVLFIARLIGAGFCLMALFVLFALVS